MHDPLTQITHCLCLGLHYEEITELINFLRPSTALARNPLFVPVSLLVLSCKQLSTSVDGMQEALWQVQKETELYGAGIVDSLGDFGQPNLPKIIRKLTNLSDTYTRSLSSMKSLEQVLKLVEEVFREQYRGGTPGYSIIQSEVQIIQHQVEWFQASAQSQVQTVCG